MIGIKVFTLLLFQFCVFLCAHCSLVAVTACAALSLLNGSLMKTRLMCSFMLDAGHFVPHPPIILGGFATMTVFPGSST